MPHNHPPTCCCPIDDENGGLRSRCSSCVQHGDLCGEPRCPVCLEAVGRPHTEYCAHLGTVA